MYRNSATVNKVWKQFLLEAGARIDNGQVYGFAEPADEVRAAANGNILAELSSLALIHAQGGDARDFLQSQLSNDINAVDHGHTQLSAYCSPKGRMFAIFQILQRDDGYLLQLPAALEESVLKRLRMYVLRANVTLDPVSDELPRIGVCGPTVTDSLREALGEVPANINESRQSGAVTVVRLPGPHPRFELVAEAEALIDLWPALQKTATPVGPAAWAWLDIMTGVPTIAPETVEAFVPQMANLDLLDGINFKKGCYPGQEIVARMRYLGKLKQRMYRAHLAGDAIPSAGDRVYAPDFPGQAAGAVTAAQPCPTGGYDLLVVVQISSAAAGELHLGKPDGPLLTLEDLPYDIPASQQQDKSGTP